MSELDAFLNGWECRHPFDTPNFAIIYLPGINLAFSYQTLVGFYPRSDEMWGRIKEFHPSALWGWIVRENAWGPTTGRHLNFIDPDRKRRFPEDTFARALYAALTKTPMGFITPEYLLEPL